MATLQEIFAPHTDELDFARLLYVASEAVMQTDAASLRHKELTFNEGWELGLTLMAASEAFYIEYAESIEYLSGQKVLVWMHDGNFNF